jgi:hypothetical protein
VGQRSASGGELLESNLEGRLGTVLKEEELLKYPGPVTQK